MCVLAFISVRKASRSCSNKAQLENKHTKKVLAEGVAFAIQTAGGGKEKLRCVYGKGKKREKERKRERKVSIEGGQTSMTFYG